MTVRRVKDDSKERAAEQGIIRNSFPAEHGAL
jgi:hypothetical protein